MTTIDKPFALLRDYQGETTPFRIDKETAQKFIGARERLFTEEWERREARIDKGAVIARFYTEAGMRFAQRRAKAVYEGHAVTIEIAQAALNIAKAARERAWLAAMVEEGL